MERQIWTGVGGVRQAGGGVQANGIPPFMSPAARDTQAASRRCIGPTMHTSRWLDRRGWSQRTACTILSSAYQMRGGKCGEVACSTVTMLGSMVVQQQEAQQVQGGSGCAGAAGEKACSTARGERGEAGHAVANPGSGTGEPRGWGRVAVVQISAWRKARRMVRLQPRVLRERSGPMQRKGSRSVSCRQRRTAPPAWQTYERKGSEGTVQVCV